MAFLIVAGISFLVGTYVGARFTAWFLRNDR